MTSSNRSLPDRQVLPKTYLPVELKNGNAVIPRDFFAVLSIILAPYFETAVIDNANHATGKNTLGVRKVWLHKVIKNIFGKQYRDMVRMGWNNGLSNEMPKNTSGASAARRMDSGVDFSFKGKTPTTIKDATDIVFGDEVTKMVKDGNIATAGGLLYKWGYYLTMEGAI